MTPRLLIVGIDPGRKGGVVAINERSELVFAERMPWLNSKPPKLDLEELDSWIVLRAEGRHIHLALERTAPASKGANATRSLAEQRGALLAWAERERYAVELIGPQAWSKEMLEGLGYKGHDQKKRAAIGRVRELWPDLRMPTKADQEAFSDAALIAEYGRRRWMGRTLLEREGAA